MEIKFDTSHPIAQGIDGDGLAGGEDSFLDYATSGVGAAAVSGVVGTVNSLMGIANLAGADFEYVDERSTISDTLGEGTAEFYDRHKQGVDVVGALASAIVPGTLAVKALRTAQLSGRLSTGMQLGTGLAEGDVILGSRAVQAARASVQAQPRWTGGFSQMFTNEAKRNAIAAGFKQNVLEASVFEATALLTTNQSISLNPEHTDTVSAMGEIVKDGWKFMLAGPVIGTALDGLKISKYLAESFKEPERAAMQAFVKPLLSTYNPTAPAGDSLSILIGARKSFAEVEASRSAVGQEFMAAIDNAIQAHAVQIMGNDNATVRQFVQMAIESNDPAAFLANARNVRSGTVEEFSKAADWTAKRQTLGFTNRGYSEASFVQDWAESAVLAQGTPLTIAQKRIIEEHASRLRNDLGTESVNGLTYAPISYMRGFVPFSQSTDSFPIRFIHVKPDEILQENIDYIYGPIARKLGIAVPTVEELRNKVILHELGHLTTNSGAHVAAVDAALLAFSKGKSSALMEQLFAVSREMRQGQFEAYLQAYRKEHGLEKVSDTVLLRKLAGDMATGQGDYYILRAKELLADAAAAIADPARNERISKAAPSIAKLFNKYGSLAAPWSKTKQYWDSVSGTVKNRVIGTAADIGEQLSLARSANGIELRSGNRTYAANNSLFNADTLREQKISGLPFDHMEYSRQHARAGLMKLEDFSKDLEGNFHLHEDALPEMEKLLTLAPEGSFFSIGKDGMVFDADMLKSYLQGRKEELRAIMSDTINTSTEEIESMLNVNLGEFWGALPEKIEWTLQGKQNWAQPRYAVVEYGPINPEAAIDRARSMPTVNLRAQVMKDTQQKAAAEVIGQFYERLPGRIDALETLSQTDSFGGMLSAPRGEFGSALSAIQYIGKVTTDIIAERRKILEDAFSKWYSIFNHTENKVLRTELALAENFGRRGHSRILPTAVLDETAGSDARMLVQESAMREAQAMASEAGDPESWMAFLPDILDETNHMKLSKQLGDFVEWQISQNDKHLAQAKELGKARFQHISGELGRFYVAPRDLKDERYFSFVVPSAAAQSTENGRYMVFGRTQQELDAKIALIRQREGNRYHIVTRQEVNMYKQLQGEYDKGRVFDELQFDSSMQKIGNSSELLPNLDVQGSSALERFRASAHRKDEALLRSAIELQYANEFGILETLGNRFGIAEDNKLASGLLKREKDNAYTKARNMALAIRGHDGPVAYLWKSVNDYVGEHAGAIIDGTMRAMSQKAKLTETDFNQINQLLEQNGVVSPFKQMSEMLIASTDSRVSRTAPTLVRTLNNMASLLTLRLDPLNSIVQTISTPILALPVIREALAAMPKDTEAGGMLRNMLTTPNPITKDAEPTAFKLFTEATRRFFTPEGKQRLEEYINAGLIQDFMYEYREAMDFSELTGGHSLQVVNDTLDKIGRIGGSISQHSKAEQFSRFMVAESLSMVCELRGITGAERMSVISSGLDKVHGVYRHSQRANLFNGVLGQSIGLFQTYTFNFMQNALRHLETGDKKNLALLAGLQSSVFGIRSWPGFQSLNTWVAETNSGRQDLYTVSNADDPKSWAAYLYYGLGSHALGIPVDLYSRGDMAFRNTLIVPNPTNPAAFPAVAVIAKGVGAMLNTGKMVSDALTGGGTDIKGSLLHGIAHNGMNRPLQGLGTIAQGYVSDNSGKPLFLNTNHVDGVLANEYNYSAGFARLLGGRPFDEGVMLDAYYRSKQYKAITAEKVAAVGESMRVSLANGKQPTPEDWNDFALKYEKAGGRVENFNAYASRIMAAMNKEAVMETKARLEQDTVLRRSYQRMLQETKETNFDDFNP